MALWTYVLFVVGIPLLWKSADVLVDGGVRLARRAGISSLVVGLTLVSFGTSAPEMAVNLVAAFQGSTDLAVGNLFGSNVANTLLVLGAAALVCPVAISRPTVRRELPLSILTAVLVGLLANDALGSAAPAILGRFDALVLLLGFVAYLAMLAGGQRGTRVPKVTEGPSALWAAGMMLVGLVGLGVSSQWLVDGALTMAADLGISEGLVGFTVVALGTSLPELATTVAAAWKGEPDVAVGNVVGSNIFNLLLVLGATALVLPIPYEATANVDLVVIGASGALVMLFVWGGRELDWRHGAFLVLGYVGYLAYRISLG